MEQNYSKVFETLNRIDCSAHTETKKQGTTNLTYLSWAWAWAEVKKAFPNATFNVYENAQGWNYHTDGRTAWVKTGVTIEGVEMIEYLPVMDFRNQSIPLENVTSFDVIKAIQRSLTKAAARHGLGLYIYAGEDLPESGDEQASKQKKASKPAADPTPQDILKACKSKEELRKVLTINHWTSKPELVSFATELSNNLPEK